MDAEKRLAQTIKADLRFNKIKIGDYLINYVTAGSGKPLLLIHGGNIGWNHPIFLNAEIFSNFRFLKKNELEKLYREHLLSFFRKKGTYLMEKRLF